LSDTGPIKTLRTAIQDDPLVVQALAEKLKDLKVIFKHFCSRARKFTFEQSALKMFEMNDAAEL